MKSEESRHGSWSSQSLPWMAKVNISLSGKYEIDGKCFSKYHLSVRFHPFLIMPL